MWFMSESLEMLRHEAGVFGSPPKCPSTSLFDDLFRDSKQNIKIPDRSVFSLKTSAEQWTLNIDFPKYTSHTCQSAKPNIKFPIFTYKKIIVYVSVVMHLIVNVYLLRL